MRLPSQFPLSLSLSSFLSFVTSLIALSFVFTTFPPTRYILHASAMEGAILLNYYSLFPAMSRFVSS